MLKLNYNVINTPPPEGNAPSGLQPARQRKHRSASHARRQLPPKPLPQVGTHRESSDHYAAVVAQLHPRWRVIEGACGLQWVLQYRRSGQCDNRWEGVSFCTTRDGLLLMIQHKLAAGQKITLDQRAMEKIRLLPARFQAGRDRDKTQSNE
jgi:hypothetical protein